MRATCRSITIIIAVLVLAGIWISNLLSVNLLRHHSNSSSSNALTPFLQQQQQTNSGGGLTVVVIANDVRDPNALTQQLLQIPHIVHATHMNRLPSSSPPTSPVQQPIRNNNNNDDSSSSSSSTTTTRIVALPPPPSSSTSPPSSWFSYTDRVVNGLQRQQHVDRNSDLPASDDNPTLAVRWYGPFWSGGGYSSEAISFVTSLKYTTPLQIFHMGDMYREQFIKGMDQHMVHELRTMEQTFIDATKSVSVCHTPPREWFATSDDAGRVRCPPDGAAYTIGRTMFETDSIPSSWVERLNRMDAVWVPSRFNLHTFVKAGVNASRVRVVPESVDTEFFNPANAQQSKLIPPRQRPPSPSSAVADGGEGGEGSHTNRSPLSSSSPFVFLSVFKWEERKGWRFLIEAYLSEFRRDENVVLYILSDQEANSPKLQMHLTQHFTRMGYNQTRLDSLPEIRFLRHGIGQAELRDLYSAADAFVLPSRGEGWGRPHVEAMSMALPVIVTMWSGPEEFLTTDPPNSYPLKIDGLEDIQEPAFFRGFKWAKPSVAHLRTLMRHVVEHPDEARARGRQARADMKRRFCPRCVAELVIRELRLIEERIHLKPEFSPSFSLNADDVYID